MFFFFNLCADFELSMVGEYNDNCNNIIPFVRYELEVFDQVTHAAPKDNGTCHKRIIYMYPPNQFPVETG